MGTEPDYGDARALAEAWSESTLEYLHRLTCEDPVTGLASLAHLQSRVSELYRGQLRDRPAPWESHALVVVEVDHPRQRRPIDTEPFATDLRTARFAETARTVFSGPDTLGRLGRHRIAVVTDARRAAGPAGHAAAPDAVPARGWMPGSGSRGCRPAAPAPPPCSASSPTP